MKGVALEMAATPEKADVRAVVAVLVDVAKVTNEIELSKWQEMDEEGMAYFFAGARANLVRETEQTHPGHLYAFLPPVLDEKARLGLSREALLARKVRIHFRAAIYRPLLPDTESPDSPRNSFLSWARKVLGAFKREDPIEALADAWAMGMRPKDPTETTQ